jgi:acetyltransferase-like isoleucine patch superfamily enzyme
MSWELEQESKLELGIEFGSWNKNQVGSWELSKVWRACSTALTIAVTEATVCGLAVFPVVWLWSLVDLQTETAAVRLAIYSVIAMPSYVVFALALMIVSPLATRLTRARTPRDVELRLADFDWQLMTWCRYIAAIHVVRLFAGSLFRGTPIWTTYLRWNGARLGRRVYVNTLSISDHNLLEFGDGVVIGGDVHVSGHVVEGGMLKTAAVRLGPGVTVGLGSVINIGVEAGPGCQIGALSLVPKYTRLDGGAVYVGVPVRRLVSADPELTSST